MLGLLLRVCLRRFFLQLRLYATTVDIDVLQANVDTFPEDIARLDVATPRKHWKGRVNELRRCHFLVLIKLNRLISVPTLICWLPILLSSRLEKPHVCSCVKDITTPLLSIQ